MLHVWITGATGGIGKAIAKALVDTCKVSVSARSPDQLLDLEKELGRNATAFPCDVSSRDSVFSAYEAVTGVNGNIDVLVNSAGVGVWKPFTDFTEEEFDNILSINLKGKFNCIQSVLPSMIESKCGMIITINSIAAITAYKANGVYGASMAGTLGMTRVLRKEVRGAGIKITDVIVGATLTDIWAETAREQFSQRMMIPDDVGGFVAKLLDDFHNNRMVVEEVIIRPQGGDL